MATTSTTTTYPKQSRPTFALDESHRLAQRMRPPTTPAYYLGRPAWMWMAVFNRTKRRA
jgi:hypothetical protein